MADPYIGEIRLVGFNFAPENWAFCQGQLLSISEFEALFTLLGTTYGGDGQSTFALPDLRGRVVMHQGTGQSSYLQGQTGGAATVTLTTNQMPAHLHNVSSQQGAGGSKTPAGNYVAQATPPIYATVSGYEAMGSIIGASGSSQPHDNMQPYLAMNYIISLYGIYPSQN